MKIYITGSCASGKTTLAKVLSKKMGLEHYSLDDIIYDRSCSDEKRDESTRDKLFLEILNKNSWIIEDYGRQCFQKGFEIADTIILMEVSKFTRRKRIIFRWIKQRLKIEKLNYCPSLSILKRFLIGAKKYETGEDGFFIRLNPYMHKVISIKNNRDLVKLYDKYTN